VISRADKPQIKNASTQPVSPLPLSPRNVEHLLFKSVRDHPPGRAARGANVLVADN
jgi:hypothetical protein